MTNNGGFMAAVTLAVLLPILAIVAIGLKLQVTSISLADLPLSPLLICKLPSLSSPQSFLFVSVVGSSRLPPVPSEVAHCIILPPPLLSTLLSCSTPHSRSSPLHPLLPSTHSRQQGASPEGVALVSTSVAAAEGGAHAKMTALDTTTVTWSEHRVIPSHLYSMAFAG